MNFNRINLVVLSITLFYNFLYCQLPIKLSHPTQNIIKRLAILNQVPFEYLSASPLSTIETINSLKKHDSPLSRIHQRNITIPKRDTSLIESSWGWKFNNFKTQIFKNELNENKKYFFQIFNDSSTFWLDWNESLTMNSNKQKYTTQYLDSFSFKGIIKNKIFLLSNFSMNRLKTDKDITPQINYNGEWKKYFPEHKTLLWYKNLTSLYVKNSIFDFEISNFPFSWGWSPQSSPIIASSAIPFNRFSIYKKFKKIQFEYFHGSLSSSSINDIHTENIKDAKYIAGHRIQFKLNNKFHTSFSEIVLYGNRSPEVAYLNPISFFWAQEHNLGDLDNVLMSFDFAWNILSGLAIYNTFFIDELSWKDIQTNWWGNKYAYQLGLFFAPSKLTLPDLRIEYTYVRPWTYTHSDFPYTHREESLASSYGPSSAVFHIESFYYPKPRFTIQTSLDYIIKGDGLGSSVNDNYDLRNKDLDYDTKSFVGNKNIYIVSNIIINYQISNYFQISYNIHYNEQFGNHYATNININL
tara:strand:+ start:425 stop:1996 length:1572 start_codon:yes stop_codon:yes gene_type:complete